MDLPGLKQEYPEMIPEFDGQPELLPRVLEISEKFVNKLCSTHAFFLKLDLNTTNSAINLYTIVSTTTSVKGYGRERSHSFFALKRILLNIYFLYFRTS